MRQRKPILIISTGSAIDSVRRRLGDFGHWFRIALGVAPEAIAQCAVWRGEALPPAQGFAATVITGSAAMVTDRAAWSEATADWLKRAVDDRHPLLGVCYGHQLLAHAMGGRIDFNPRGREIGTAHIELLPPAADDPLFGPLAPGFLAHTTHRQSVLEAPPGALVLARSALDDCHALRIGECAYGVQFHPEFSTAAMRAYIRARAGAIADEGQSPRMLDRAVSAAPQARALLRRFARRHMALGE